MAGLLIGFVGILIALRPHPTGATPARPRSDIVAAASTGRPSPVSIPADAARSAALFDRNRSMPSDPDLASEYEDLNLEYFSNILPAPAVRWETGLADLGPMIADGFTVQGLTDGRMILLNPAVGRDAEQRRRALCHEMVHMAVWQQDNAHGPIFQERLRQLSLRGAFKGIVATDEEKDETLATLKRKHAELEAEDRALRTTRQTLDLTSQIEVDGYNARARRQRNATADYNKLVEQYNLMIQYPDGLARERLKARADGTMPDDR